MKNKSWVRHRFSFLVLVGWLRIWVSGFSFSVPRYFASQVVSLTWFLVSDFVGFKILIVQM